jgi:hypothetical protein
MSEGVASQPTTEIVSAEVEPIVEPIAVVETVNTTPDTVHGVATQRKRNFMCAGLGFAIPLLIAVIALGVVLGTTKGKTPSTSQLNLSTPTPGSGTTTTKPLTSGGPNTDGVAFTSKRFDITPKPTKIFYAPDNRVYVANGGGKNGKSSIISYAVDEDYNTSDVEVIDIISQTYPTIPYIVLGMTTNPFEGDNWKLYVTISFLFPDGGKCIPSGLPIPYPNKVLALTKVSKGVWTLKVVAEGIPNSGYDHATNGLVFTSNGDILVGVGSATNAGIKNCKLGNLDNNPLDDAILKIPFSNGAGYYNAKYFVNGVETNDMRYGINADVTTDMEVVASGARNPFQMIMTTSGHFLFTDNGPNTGFGTISVSATVEGGEITSNKDKLNKVVAGKYYGYPNRNRGRKNAWENTYIPATDLVPTATYKPAVTLLDASSSGLTQYRSMALGSKAYNSLFIQKYKGSTRYVIPSDDMESIIGAVQDVPGMGLTEALDIFHAPGGVLLTAAYQFDHTDVSFPVDKTTGATAYDITPWRTPAAGGNKFVIGGKGFGDSATVTINGISCTVTSVTAKRIYGVFPAMPASPTLLDVVVSTNGIASTIPKAVRFLGAPGSEPTPIA